MVEHAVLLRITSLRDHDTDLDELEDPRIEAIQAAGFCVECDGNDNGADGAVLYMCGPDADRLWDAIETTVRAAWLGSGSYVSSDTANPVRRKSQPLS